METSLSTYIDCALWASDTEPTDERPHGQQMSELYSVFDLSPGTYEAMRADVARFLERAGADQWNDKDFSRAGHDFWLTRNGHGAGFWTGAYWQDDDGDRLTELSKTFSECNLHVGDDGKIYHGPVLDLRSAPSPIGSPEALKLSDQMGA